MELTYTRAGDYEIPNIALSQTGSIGHYGRLRREYLRHHRTKNPSRNAKNVI